MKRAVALSGLAVLALAAGGCGGSVPGARVPDSALSQPCAPTQASKPLGVPELISIGDDQRDLALHKLARGESAGDELFAASYCYSSAQALAPDSYAAALGLGVTYIARAKSIADREDPVRRSYLMAAKRALGQAYMLRQGPYEPLYYLAEVAVLENDAARTAAFLDPLKKAGAKRGPVYAIEGYLAYENGDHARAESLWLQALQAGWPHETMRYAAEPPRRVAPGTGLIVAGSVFAGITVGVIAAGAAVAAAEPDIQTSGEAFGFENFGYRERSDDETRRTVGTVVATVGGVVFGVPSALLFYAGGVRMKEGQGDIAKAPGLPTVRVGLSGASFGLEF